MAVTPLHTPGERQVRLYFSHSTVAQLIDYQRRFVEAGMRKPTYSDIIGAAISCTQRLPFSDVVAAVEGRS